VLVSAFIAKHGHPALLLELAVTLEGIQLVLSEPILRELEDVLSRDEVRGRFTYAAKNIREIVRSITRSAEILRPKSKFKTVKEDPKDDVVLRNPRQVEEMGRNGRIFAQLHDWTIVASQTEQVYKDVFSATA